MIDMVDARPTTCHPAASSTRYRRVLVLVDPLLRAIVVTGLAVDAWVHLRLGASFDAIGTVASQGDLFRGAAVAAVVVAVGLLVVPRRHAAVGYLVACAVAAISLAVLLLTTYAPIHAVGPFPDMYDPSWYRDKVLAAVGEALAVGGAASGAVILGRLVRRE